MQFFALLLLRYDVFAVQLSEAVLQLYKGCSGGVFDYAGALQL